MRVRTRCDDHGEMYYENADRDGLIAMCCPSMVVEPATEPQLAICVGCRVAMPLEEYLANDHTCNECGITNLRIAEAARN